MCISTCVHAHHTHQFKHNHKCKKQNCERLIISNFTCFVMKNSFPANMAKS